MQGFQLMTELDWPGTCCPYRTTYCGGTDRKTYSTQLKTCCGGGEIRQNMAQAVRTLSLAFDLLSSSVRRILTTPLNRSILTKYQTHISTQAVTLELARFVALPGLFLVVLLLLAQ